MTEGKGLVLVVEDERPIADLVRLYLTRDGYGVHLESDGAAGLAAARRLRPVACVLDIGLPGMDGTEVCRRLRESGDWTPVIFLTARDDEVDRVVGLELGADDYVTKPFSPRELVARIKAVLRRATGPPEAADTPRSVGGGHPRPGPPAGPRRRRGGGPDVDGVRPAGPPHATTGAGLHARGAARVRVGVRRPRGTRTVDVHVAQVRSKLADASPLARDVIRTVRGVGYTADEVIA